MNGEEGEEEVDDDHAKDGQKPQHVAKSAEDQVDACEPSLGDVVGGGGSADTREQAVHVLEITVDDMDAALGQVRPTALQEVFLETPQVRWSDIGGQHEIKQRLQNAIEWPLKLADRMAQLDLRPKKGVLLYGPPGCSKTMLVKALATEAGLNFLAVKGAELVSMYVGESERAVREVFRKARAASPSILFFDEVDALASRGDGEGGGGRTDFNVLTTLLNEMDGFEELRAVFVVAATNKPRQIDPALLRPGRLDNAVYIGPPDLAARREILASRLRRSPVVADADADADSTDAADKPDGPDGTDITAVDADDLARMTEGYSGAEIVGIWQTAGERALQAGRRHRSAADFRHAVAETPRGITADMVAAYRRWSAARV